MSNKLILEDSRNALLNKSKNDSKKSKQRYKRRVKSQVANTVQSYNEIDMNKLFKLDILTVGVPVKGETNNYVVKISFGGFLDELHRNLKEKDSLNLNIILRSLLSAINKEDVYVSCTCLHPDTKIKLLDGRTMAVEDMCSVFERGEKLYVYSVDKNGDFKPGEVEKVWKTGNSSNFIRVILDNDEEILTTSDHLYMLRDGSYLPANELKVGQSLMPIYFNETKNGYETVKFNSTGKYHSTYKVVAESLKYSEIEEAKKRVKENDNMSYDVAIHHVDFNKSNNTPENLQPMTAREHWEYHAHTMSRLWENEEFKNKQSEKAREWMTRLNANPTDKLLAERKNWQQAGTLRNYDEDRKKQQSDIAKNVLGKYWDSLTEEEAKEIRSKNRNDNWKKSISESHKQYWKNISDEEYQKRLEKIIEVNNRPDIKAKSVERMRNTQKRLYSDPLYKRRLLISQISKVIDKILENNEIPSPETYEKYRTRGYCRYTCAFSSWQELSEYFKLNHSIKKIECVVLENTPVYDIKVKDYENFLTNAGVILHNCPDNYYRMSYIQTKMNINSGEPQNIPANITNPYNNLGSGCKHILLVLSNLKWVVRVSSTIHNYIKYMEIHYPKMYADIIYPAIYKKKYEEPVQLSFDDAEEISSDKDIIDVSNKEGRSRGQFKPANTQGIRFASKPKAIQQEFTDEENNLK